MDASKSYNHLNREQYWYNKWLENNFFASKPNDKEPYTVIMPPPNVTGILHMGHTLNGTIQDILIRKARMEGKNACWVPGTDHASIATEAKVVNLLKEQGISKFDIGRDKFLEHAFEWKNKYGGIILDQVKKLGLSVDWEREAFTMDEERYKSVIDAFNRLYKKGLVYRGARMINWDPKAKTALSDEEVIHKEAHDKLYYCKYQIAGTDDYLTIATTRPETIMADAAICINPNDERFTHLRGKKAIVPLVNREIPIIEDEYVDLEFGTGCLKVTPAHDINDYQLGLKHGLEVIDLLNDDGTLNENAQFFVGIDREVARNLVADELDKMGQLDKIEDITHNVGTSERTGVVIEPKISTQWFVDMKSMGQSALDVVLKDEVKFHPPKFKNTYKHWMENIKDWCISRQLWWGHRIPAWYLPNGEFVVATNETEALEKAQAIIPNIQLSELKQDEDVLDTWFSSWLWPISVFNGVSNPNNEEINYYYPTSTLVTGPDIIFFWVARMIMAGLEYRDTIPFKDVYFTGMVRDKQGRKMSKSLGNSPDLLNLIDKYGADGVRFGILFASPAGNDLLYDDKLCDQGANFINKIWNAHKLIETWHEFEKIVDDAPDEIIEKNKLAADLFNQKLQQTIQEVNDSLAQFRISEALQSIYKLLWNDFCSSYLEWVKPKKDTVIDKEAYYKTITFFEECLKMLHPFMPFITEELYQILQKRDEGDFICVAQFPNSQSIEIDCPFTFNQVQEIVSAVRNHKVENGLSFSQNIELLSSNTDLKSINPIVTAASGAYFKSISTESENELAYKSFLIGAHKIWNSALSNQLTDEEKASVLAEIKRLNGFLFGIDKKLSNEKFVNNAPKEVLEKEEKKRSDTLLKLKALEEKIA